MYFMPQTDIVTTLADNQLLVALVGAVIAACLAYVLGLRSQAKLLKTQTKLHMYDDFWDAKNNLSNAVIEYHVSLMGIPTQLITMRYSNSSKETLKGITTKTDAQYDFETRQEWGKHLERIATRGNDITMHFGKVHTLVEKSYFMYPKIDKTFKLIADKNQELFNAQLDLIGELYKPDAIELLDTKNEEALMKVIEDSRCVEMCADMIAYTIDFFALLQKELVGDVFKFKIDERKPVEGLVLTKKGWKSVKPQKKRSN
jgi:hypothetical protein